MISRIKHIFGAERYNDLDYGSKHMTKAFGAVVIDVLTIIEEELLKEDADLVSFQKEVEKSKEIIIETLKIKD
jgi:hypothetical protein